MKKEKILKTEALLNMMDDLEEAKRKAEENEESFRAVFDSANDAIFVHDLKTGEVVDVNKRAMEFVGIDDRKELLGISAKKFSSGMGPFTEGEALKWIRKAAKKPQIFEWQTKTKKGEIRWVEVSLRRGKILGKDRIIAIIRDTTSRKLAEEKIKESEERYKGIFESSPEAIVLVSPEGKVVDVNDRLYDWLGYRPKEIIGMSVFRLPYITSEGKKKIKNIFKRRIRGEEIPPYEIGFITRKGEKRVGEVRGSAVKDSTGNIIGSLVMVTDITERKKAEKKIISLQKVTRDILDNAPFGAYTIDGKGIIDYFNPSMVKMAGAKDVQRVIGLNALTLSTYKKAGLTDYFRKGLKGKAFRAENIRYISYTGKKESIRNYSGIPIKDEEGKVEHLLMIVDDISEKVRAEEELRSEKEFIHNVMEHAGMPILLCSVKGDIRFMNESFLRMTGYRKEEIYDLKELRRKIFPTRLVSDKVDEIFKNIKKGKHVNNIVLPVLRKDNSTTLVITNTTPLRDAGHNIIGCSIFMHDLSEVFNLEGQLRYWAANGFIQKVIDETHKEGLMGIPALEITGIDKPIKPHNKKKRRSRSKKR